MVLRNCTVCNVYGEDDQVLARVRVKCTGEDITLHFKKNNELSDSERIRIDFFDGQIGYIKTYCEILVRKNYDPLILEPWMADCEILEVVDIVQRQKDLRTRMEKEVTFTSHRQGTFSGTIQNISGGGLYIVTNARLNIDEEIEFSHCFIKKLHNVKAIVLREQSLKNNHYGYGCQFIELTKAAERDIRQFVYKQQLSRAW